MLQQNNNNNSLCLDMAHRELLQGCGRSSAPLSFGAIGFGAIPLIKGLRAWAVSGGFNARNKRKTAGELQSHQQMDRQRGWKAKENIKFRPPGALVTVATLKGSEGVRQTQTRCLFLKAEGCSYVCTVGNNRPAGSRAAGPRLHPSSAEATAGETHGLGRGRRASQDAAGAGEVKPQVVRKWRKSSKVVKSAAESRNDVASSKPEQGQGAKGDFTSRIDGPKTSDCDVTPCLKAKHKYAASSIQPGTVHKSTDGNEKVCHDETHLHRCQPDTSAKASSSVSSSSEVYVGQEMLRPCKDSVDEATDSIKQKSDLVADVDLNRAAKTKDMHFVSDVPKSKEFSPEELMQVDVNRNANISHSYEETSISSIGAASRTPLEGSRIDSPNSNNETVTHSEGLDMASTKSPLEVISHNHEHAGVENGSKTKMDKDLIKSENGQSNVVIHSEEVEKDEDLDMANTRGQGHVGPLEERSPKNEKNQSDPKEMEKDEGVDMACTDSPKKDPGLGLDLSGVETGSKATMDKDSLKNEGNQHEVVVHCEKIKKDEDVDMPSTNSGVEDPCQGQGLAGIETGFKPMMVKDSIESENDQPKVVIQSGDMQKDKDLDMASSKIPLEDPGRVPNLSGLETGFRVRMDQDSIENEKNPSEVVMQSEEIEKDEGLDMVNNKSQKKDPGQDLDLVGMETGFKVMMDKGLLECEMKQSEVVKHSEKMEKDEGLDMVSTKSLKKDPGQDLDIVGKETGFKATVDKDSLEDSNDKNRPEGVIDCEELGNAKDSTTHPVGHPSQGLDLSGMESGCMAKMKKDCLSIEKNQPEVIIPSEQMEKDEDEVLDMTSGKTPLRNASHDHDLARMDKDSLKNEKNPSEMFICCEEMGNDEDLDIANTRSPREDPGQGPPRPLEERCPPQHMEVSSGCEEQWFAKSPSRGSLKAPAPVATARLLNPAFTSTSNSTTAIATAPSALGRQEEVGAGFRSLRPQPESALVSEQERGQDWSKVATNERPVEVGEEEEDEFGVFMQAGEEQVWTEFSELRQVPSGTHDGIGCRNSADANESMSWTSDWTGVQSFHQSDDSWTAFKQEDDSRGAESEIAPTGQWWSSTAVEKSHLTLSSLQNGSQVFLEAFPCVDSTGGEPDCVPTLRELLQGPAENNRAMKPQNQSLLDGLQDLDRMIDVKYKRAESLSRKLLLQSLHLGAVSSERDGRKQPTARFSPNLPTSNQQLAANAKRRLSYDINRNIMT